MKTGDGLSEDRSTGDRSTGDGSGQEDTQEDRGRFSVLQSTDNCLGIALPTRQAVTDLVVQWEQL